MQHALIVDDSKTASHALRQMLQRLHFQVDTAESAEAALDYLKICRPQLIFMDHIMPGMDGFDAVKAIKSDPVTAEIPIVMYTSKEGDIYVGQARALGAADILTKPANNDDLNQVLQRLKLLQYAKRPLQSAAMLSAADAVSTDTAINNIDDDDTSLFIPLSSRTQNTTTTQEPRSWLWSLALMIALAGLFALYISNGQERQAAQAQRTKFAETLAWSFSQAGQYGFNQIPFDDERLQQVQSLVESLRELQFRGTLIIESRVGDFCIARQRLADGRVIRQLAPADFSITDCSELGQDEYKALELAGQQSPAFRAYVTKMKNDPDITIQLVPIGSARPLVAYPGAGESGSAADWNAVALRNQSVTYKVVPQNR